MFSLILSIKQAYLNDLTLIVEPVVEAVRFMLPVFISIWSPDDMKQISKLCNYKIMLSGQNTYVSFVIDAKPSIDEQFLRS